MRHVFACLCLLLFLVGVTRADDVVDSRRTGTMSVLHTNQRMKTVFGVSRPPPTSKALDLYKVRYRSDDAKGRPIILSGLLALPRGGAPRGLVIYNHGVTADRRLSPSLFTGAAKSSEVEFAVLAFASGGYAVAMPDYLGLGDDKSAHPFPLGSVNSRSAIDLIAPARTLAARYNVAVGSRLFIAGYSEGGAVAMWTVRMLEQDTTSAYQVFSAVPMSGPYDLSGVTRQSLIEQPTNAQAFATRLYLMALIAHYFHKSEGVRLTDYFKPTMAAAVSRVFNRNHSDETIIKRLALTAILMRAKNSIDRVITPQFKKALQTADADDPIIRALVRNDCYDWTPRTKMLLINLKNDGVVSPANTQKAMRTMRSRGVGADSLRQQTLADESLNHVTGAAPSFVQARRFFDNGFAGF